MGICTRVTVDALIDKSLSELNCDSVVLLLALGQWDRHQLL